MIRRVRIQRPTESEDKSKETIEEPERTQLPDQRTEEQNRRREQRQNLKNKQEQIKSSLKSIEEEIGLNPISDSKLTAKKRLLIDLLQRTEKLYSVPQKLETKTTGSRHKLRLVELTKQLELQIEEKELTIRGFDAQSKPAKIDSK